MIVDVMMEGALDNRHVYFDFAIMQTGMDINVSAGKYVAFGVEKFNSAVGATVTIPTDPTTDYCYDLWLASDGIHVVQRLDNEIVDMTYAIDLLVWLKVPAGTTSLDSIDINAKKVIPVETKIVGGSGS